eukprot:13449823-Alexandrium_andersonii.AAC.1
MQSSWCVLAASAAAPPHPSHGYACSHQAWQEEGWRIWGLVRGGAFSSAGLCFAAPRRAFNSY